MNPFSSRELVAATAIVLALQLLVMYAAPLQRLRQDAITGREGVVPVIASLPILGITETVKTLLCRSSGVEHRSAWRRGRHVQRAAWGRR